MAVDSVGGLKLRTWEDTGAYKHRGRRGNDMSQLVHIVTMAPLGTR